MTRTKEKEAIIKQFAEGTPIYIRGVDPPFTRREQIAIAAMQGILTAHDPTRDIDYQHIAKQAVCMAGAMSRELGINSCDARTVVPAPNMNGFIPGID